jgi:hypothetical protein
MLAFVDDAGYRFINRHRGDRTEQYPEFAFLAAAPAESLDSKQGFPDPAPLTPWR